MMFTKDKVNELAIKRFEFETESTRRDLKWEPKVQFSDGSKLTAAWYRDNHWL